MTDLEPINPNHPFWSATTGSSLDLKLIKPPDSFIHSMKIVVASIIEPFIYKIVVFQEDENNPANIYVKKKEAIKIIKSEWWDFYAERTQVIFKEHMNIDISKLSAYRKKSNSSIFSLSNNSSPRSSSSENNSPRSPILSPGRLSPSFSPTSSPRNSRKNSLTSMVRLSLSNMQRKNGNSPRSGRNSTRSNTPSPRSPIWSPKENETKNP